MSTRKGDTACDLTVYLVKEGYVDIGDIVRPEANYRLVTIPSGNGILGPLLICENRSKHPIWVHLFEGIVDVGDIGRNTSTGALLFVSVDTRIFMFSFGQGRHLVKTECLESNFGLRTALCILDPNSIRSLDKSSFESRPKQAREQSGEGVGLDFFGINIESDLLRAITGRPRVEGFGNRVTGGDSLHLSIETDLGSITSLASRLNEAFTEESYKQGPFSWIDHIGQVKDRSLIPELDKVLVTRLNEGELDRSWLCASKILDWERVSWFKYSGGQKATKYHDTRIEECLREMRGSGISAPMLKRRDILAIDADDQLVFSDSVYKFMYAEVTYQDLMYILNAGQWFQISSDYVRRVEDEYKTIIKKEYERHMLEYNDACESDYNKRLAQSDPSEFARLDGDLIRLENRVSPIEACDVYRRDKELIHIKRYAGSAVLSHLFNQGLVSGELMQSEIRFRQEFNKRLPDHLKIEGIENRPRFNEFTVVFAVISEQDAGLDLPFFSKISLRHAVSRIEAFGHRVRFAKIPVNETKKKIRVMPGA